MKGICNKFKIIDKQPKDIKSGDGDGGKGIKTGIAPAAKEIATGGDIQPGTLQKGFKRYEFFFPSAAEFECESFQLKRSHFQIGQKN